jgi:VCBS repeat protein/beta-propeller repeat-containing protein
MNVPRFAHAPVLSLIVTLGVTPTATAQSSRFPAHGVDHARATAALNKLPLRLEPSDQKGVFLARGMGRAIQLTGTSIDFPLGSGSHGPDSIRLEFVGARKSSRVTGADPLPGRVNYLYGDDPARWRTNVRTYARAKTASLYRGIDVEYYDAGDELEFDFIVRPTSHPDAIRIAISGTSITIDEDGDLVYGPDARVLLRHPVAYQTIDGLRRDVTAEYRQRPDGTLQFTLGPYDHHRPLVIDPVVVYSLTFGGSDGDYPQDIAVDDAGAVYLAGYTYSHDFPTVRAYQPVPGLTCPNASCTDGFLVKIAPDGRTLEYATYFSRGPNTAVNHIAVDATHALYFSGDGNWGRHSPTPFIAKLSPIGTQLVYVFSPPTPIDDLAVGDAGAVYLATGTGVATLSPSGINYHPIFDVMSGHSPADVLATTTFTSVAVGGGSVFTAGNTTWAGFPTTPAAVQTHIHLPLMWRIREGGAEPAGEQGLEDWDNVIQLAVSPADAGVRYAAAISRLNSLGQIARSTDGGTTWTILKTPAIRYPRIVLAYHDPLTAYVFGSQDGLWKTTDGGSTFTSLPFAGAISDLSISSDDLTLYLVGEALTRVSKSINGGTTWTSLPWPSDYSFKTIDSRIPARIYAHQIGGPLMRTADDGVTWQPIPASGNLAISQSVPTTMYVATVGPSLRKSTDDGLTWETVLTAPSVVRAIVHPTSPDIVVVLTNTGWLRSNDGGATWTTLPRLSPLPTLVFDPSDSTVVLGYASRLADGFVIRMTEQGTVLYSTLLGGSRIDGVANIAVDTQGAAHLVGDTSSEDFPSTRPVSFDPYLSYRTFLAKLSPDGGSIVYARELGNGSAHATGSTRLGDFLQIGLDNAGHARTAACSKPDIDFPSWGNDCRTFLVSAGGTLLESTSTGDPPSPLVAVDPSGSSYFVRNLSGVNAPIVVTKYAPPSASVVSLTANIALPVRFGTPITWTTSTFSEDPAEYSFWHFSPVYGWEELQGFSASRTVTWTPVSWHVGDNSIRVYARAVGSTDPPVQASASFAVLGVQSSEAAVLPPAADFNNDGRPDLLWLNSDSRQLAMWNMGGGAHGEHFVGGGYLNSSPLPAGWRIAGAADIDGDGHTDLFVQSDSGLLGTWLFDGSTLRGGVLLTPSQLADPEWQIRAVGDLNHDGHPDLIWQYAPTGQVAFWLMNGTSAIGYILPNIPAPGGDWEIIGTGDSNRDGERDIFWQQRSTGALAVWTMMHGTELAGGSLLSANPGPQWRAVAVSDLDGDAYSDIVLENISTGDLGAWYLAGNTVKFGVMLVPSSVGAPGWNLVGPR